MNIVVLRIGNPHIAEELVQDAWLKSYTILAKEEKIDDSNLHGYVYRALENKVRDYFKSANTRLTSSVPPELMPEYADTTKTVEEQLITKEQNRIVAEELAKLPLSHQKSLIFYAHGLPLSEVSEQTGQPVGAVKAQRHRAVKALERRKSIRDYYEG